jgi:hypothetical protein
MKKLYITLSVLVISTLAVGLTVLNKASATDAKQIVGSWFVNAPDAPFPYHMFVFNSDGTMQQANPDAGDTNTSDSDGMGSWVKVGDKVVGRFDEVTADRSTGQFVARGEISFTLDVDSDSHFSGTASAKFYDASGTLLRGPFGTPVTGTRVTAQ